MKARFSYHLLLVLCITSSFGFAQKAERTSGAYMMKVENNMTWDEAVNKATQYAQINAIEEKFGKVIIQDNSTFIKNEQNGDLVKTNSTFNFISNSYIKGEWIEDIGTPHVEKINKENETWIKVSVKGKVREIVSPANNFIAYPLNCPEVKCKAQTFNDGQDFYVYFKSPEDGYVSIYLTDPSVNYTFLMLPYKNSASKKYVRITADKDYIFFSKKFDYFNELNAVDEQIISLSANSTSEKYQLWVLFSPESLEKPVLEDEFITTQKFLDAASIKQGYTLPKGIRQEKFIEWLQNYRLHNKNVQMSSLFLDVNKM